MSTSDSLDMTLTRREVALLRDALRAFIVALAHQQNLIMHAATDGEMTVLDTTHQDASALQARLRAAAKALDHG